MAVTSYKCPSCGAGIEYNPALRKFKCEYCLSEYSEDEIESNQSGGSHEHLQSYICNSCGAEVITDDTTSATFCYYCHNPVVLSGRLEGKFKPNKMIPFSIDKKKAREGFLKWAGNKMFIPRDFTSESQLEKITGIYLPYWWVDTEADINYLGEGRNIRVWRTSNMEYTETKKYQIKRQGEIDLKNVGEVAYTKINRSLLNGILPYRESEAVDFSMPYLSGFLAEQYNISKEDAMPMVEGHINRYYSYLINEMIGKYDSINTIDKTINIKNQDWNLTLLPAWILTYKYKGNIYVYAVNGQTGKSYGELPLSSKKVTSAFGVVFGIISILLLLGGYLIW